MDMKIEIKTERLTLKPMGPEFLHSTHAYASDAENTKYMMFMPTDSLDETRAWLEDCAAEWAKPHPIDMEFAILLDGRHIGGVGVDYLERRDAAELGWVLHPAYHGHGYATEAARAVLDFAINTLGERRFIAHCDAANLASQSVMRKLGMTLTDASGTRKNRGSDEVRQEYTFELDL
ncbi:MAG: GNAT family N-acetyltransferase [bacterium]